jgi:hypothetical protein
MGISLRVDVGQSNGTAPAAVDQLLHRSPGVQEGRFLVVDHIAVLVSRILIGAGFEGEPGVDEIEIEIVEAQPLETTVERRTNTLRSVIGVPNLRRHEQLVPGDVSAGESGPQSFADLPLVPVTLGAIEVPESGLQRVAGGDPRRVRIGYEGAESQHWNLSRIVTKGNALPSEGIDHRCSWSPQQTAITPPSVRGNPSDIDLRNVSAQITRCYRFDASPGAEVP